MRITGVCLMPDGRPAANVTIRMLEIGKARLMELPPITSKYETKTDQSGRFEFAAIPRGNNWMIQFEEEGVAADGFPNFGMKYTVPSERKENTSLFATIQIRKPTSIKWVSGSQVTDGQRQSDGGNPTGARPLDATSSDSKKPQ